MLLALLSGQRGQTLHLIDIRNIHIHNNYVKILNGDFLKSSSSKKHLGEINLANHESDDDLCVVKTIAQYIERTEPLRASVTKLFITYITKTVHVRVKRYDLKVAEISDARCRVFGPHSVRSATASTACTLRIPVLDTII